MWDDLPVEGRIDPALVRFSQDSISYDFRAGGTIEDLADALRSRSLRPNDVPPIRVFEREGFLFTLENRRLWAFREAGVLIPFRKATPEEVQDEAWKLTTKNQGASVRVKRRR